MPCCPDRGLQRPHRQVVIFAPLLAAAVELNWVRRLHAWCPRTIALNAIGFADVDVKDEEGNQLVWTYDGELINVTWADPIAKDQERKLHGTTATTTFSTRARGVPYIYLFIITCFVCSGLRAGPPRERDAVLLPRRGLPHAPPVCCDRQRD